LRVGEYFREGEGEEEKIAVVEVSERRSEERGIMTERVGIYLFRKARRGRCARRRHVRRPARVQTIPSSNRLRAEF